MWRRGPHPAFGHPLPGGEAKLATAMGVTLVRRLVYFLAALPGLWALAPARADERPPFVWKDGDRVVLIGDALIEREQEQGMVETTLTLLDPEKTIQFRNLGWSGDTVYGLARARFGTQAEGFRHLVDHVVALKPTVLIVGYGMTDSFGGKAGLSSFREGLIHLLDALAETQARVVLLSPIAHEDLGRPLPDPAQHNEVLALYRDTIREIATQRSAWFVDLFEHFTALESSLRDQDPMQRVTDDGIHLNKSGYLAMAGFVRLSLGLGWRDAKILKTTPTARGMRLDIDSGPMLHLGRYDRHDYALGKTLRAVTRARGQALPRRPVPPDHRRPAGRRGRGQAVAQGIGVVLR